MPSRRSRSVVLLLGFVLALGAGCSDDDLPTGIETDPDWAGALRGFFERPDPVETDAQGTAFFLEDGASIRYRIEVQDIDDVTLAHIHSGGPLDVGPIVVTLFDAAGDPQSFEERGLLVEGSFESEDLAPAGGIATLDALIAAMDEGDEVYVNVHTSANPDGEIRGPVLQIFPPD